MAITKNKGINVAIPSTPLSQTDFINLVKEGENGTFKAVGTFEEFKKDVLSIWQKKHSK